MDDAAWLRVHDAASSIEADPTHTLCPLLDPETRACSVYDERPLACRAYLAVTPVDDCYPERTGPRKVGTIMEPQALVGLAVAYREPVYLAAELLRRASARSC
jgi:Fe-S-cluster containining protein